MAQFSFRYHWKVERSSACHNCMALKHTYDFIGAHSSIKNNNIFNHIESDKDTFIERLNCQSPHCYTYLMRISNILTFDNFSSFLTQEIRTTKCSTSLQPPPIYSYISTVENGENHILMPVLMIVQGDPTKKL